MGGERFPFLQGGAYYASQEGLPDPIWEWIGGLEPNIPNSNGYCTSILLQEAMEAATQPPEQMTAEPPEQHEQLETVAGTNTSPNIQAVEDYS